MDKNVIDFRTDNGFEKFASFLNNGELRELPRDLNVSEILEKQAFADEEDFADTMNKMFSIATPLETRISSVYAEKVASEMDPHVLDRLNEACAIYGIPEVQITQKVASEPTIEEVFGVKFEEEAKLEISKTAAENTMNALGYGNQFDDAIAARATLVPEEEDNLSKIAALKETLPPAKMASLLQGFDEATGCDMPWVASRIGTAADAVFKKKASYLDINIGSKSYPIEELAEKNAAFESLGINIDFDEDPYTVKLALERLPKRVHAVLNKIL